MRSRVGFAFVFASAAITWACSTFESSDEPSSPDASVDAPPPDAAEDAPAAEDAGSDVRLSLCETIDAEYCENFDKGVYPWTFKRLTFSDAAVTFATSDAAWSAPSSLHIESSSNSDSLLTWPTIPVGPNGVTAECRIRLGGVTMNTTDDVFGISVDPQRGVSFGYDVDNAPTMFVNLLGKPTAKYSLSEAVGEWSRIEMDYAVATGAITLRVDGVQAASATGSVAADAGTLSFSVGALTLGSGTADVYVDDCAAYPN